MEGYLGEELIEDLTGNIFESYTDKDWAIYFIENYGQFDGGHHKQWAMDQVVRILKGSPIIVKKASWSNGYFEYRVSVGEPSKKYLEWVEEYNGESNEYGETEYNYGIAP